MSLEHKNPAYHREAHSRYRVRFLFLSTQFAHPPAPSIPIRLACPHRSDPLNLVSIKSDFTSSLLPSCRPHPPPPSSLSPNRRLQTAAYDSWNQGSSPPPSLRSPTVRSRYTLQMYSRAILPLRCIDAEVESPSRLRLEHCRLWPSPRATLVTSEPASPTGVTRTAYAVLSPG